MGAHDISGYLRQYAKQAEHAIVEVGAWLGAGTYHLARGTEKGNSAPIYVYDAFMITESEARRAADQGYEIEKGTDTKELVKSHVDYENLILNQTRVKDIEWEKKPISVYVDDAGKGERDFKHKMEQFEPYFTKETACFFMDINFCKMTGFKHHKYQYEYVNDKYRCIRSFGRDTGGLYVPK